MGSIINAIIEDDLEWLEELINEKGPNVTDNDGNTPLMFCIQEHRNQMIDFLLDMDLDVDKANNDGNTALSNAVFYANGEIDVIEKLLEKGADMNKVNKAGVSPLSLANTMKSEKVVAFMNNWKK